jgi:hypothetical protein
MYPPMLAEPVSFGTVWLSQSILSGGERTIDLGSWKIACITEWCDRSLSRKR